MAADTDVDQAPVRSRTRMPSRHERSMDETAVVDPTDDDAVRGDHAIAAPDLGVT
jgi:hypothetical protein